MVIQMNCKVMIMVYNNWYCWISWFCPPSGILKRIQGFRNWIFLSSGETWEVPTQLGTL